MGEHVRCINLHKIFKLTNEIKSETSIYYDDSPLINSTLPINTVDSTVICNLSAESKWLVYQMEVTKKELSTGCYGIMLITNMVYNMRPVSIHKCFAVRTA